MNTRKVWPLLLTSFPQISARQACGGTVCVGLHSRVVRRNVCGLTKSGGNGKDQNGHRG